MNANARPRLLIVDDEPICRRAVADLALAFGLECDNAADGLSGLELARRQCYDLLLIDWRMPGMTGSEMMEALRADPQAASRGSRMVLVTGERVDAAQERARGFDAVLAKPLSSEQLGQLLGTLVPSATSDPVGAVAVLLDDVAALASLGGSKALLQSLRQMLVLELQADLLRMPEQRAAGAVPALRERLHQLTGGARYCGAVALAAAADQWRQTIKAGLPDAEAWAHFQETARATMTVIESPPAP
ncbi:MAG: response regulator [Xanthomonadales bacterium]|jgi:CheY-like chemotaxis protein|nr:response regulator [Xanthomonadales bacterium]